MQCNGRHPGPHPPMKCAWNETAMIARLATVIHIQRKKGRKEESIALQLPPSLGHLHKHELLDRNGILSLVERSNREAI